MSMARPSDSFIFHPPDRAAMLSCWRSSSKPIVDNTRQISSRAAEKGNKADQGDGYLKMEGRGRKWRTAARVPLNSPARLLSRYRLKSRSIIASPTTISL